MCKVPTHCVWQAPRRLRCCGALSRVERGVATAGCNTSGNHARTQAGKCGGGDRKRLSFLKTTLHIEAPAIRHCCRLPPLSIKMSRSMSVKRTSDEPARKVRVAIIGAGMSGLALANGLLKDPSKFDVTIYERDSVAFDMERGGYQLRMAAGGVEALKTVSDLDTWEKLQRAWGGDSGKAPSMVNPKTMQLVFRLADVKVYPKSIAIARSDLKTVLLDKPQREGIVHFASPFDRYELVASETNPGEHEVIVHFQDAQKNPPVRADVVVAADGSNSRINIQAGINNKKKLGSWTLIQSKGAISAEVYKKLPASLKSEGANMFLAGSHYSGFAAVYKQPKLAGTSNSDEYSLFWAACVPKVDGDKMLKQAGEDKLYLVDLLAKYVTDMLHYDPSGLPFIFKNATEKVRTGAITSSIKPSTDWRAATAANSRIILMGDAIHPMTPGRGMGANQALMDAGSLVTALQATAFSPEGPTDAELFALTKAFDEEMYSRAFRMVQASEDMNGLNLTSTGGMVKIGIGKVVLGMIGFVVSALELLGVYQWERLNLEHPEGQKGR